MSRGESKIRLTGINFVVDYPAAEEKVDENGLDRVISR